MLGKWLHWYLGGGQGKRDGEMGVREGGEEGEGGGRRGAGRREKMGREKRGREEGEERKKGREGKRGNFCAREARAPPEGRRETRGGRGEVWGGRGERLTPLSTPSVLQYKESKRNISLNYAYKNIYNFIYAIMFNACRSTCILIV